VTLAALAVPQAMGYAKIAGMPVVAGLYTVLLPMAAFAEDLVDHEEDSQRLLPA
jgi:Sulfate permease family